MKSLLLCVSFLLACVACNNQAAPQPRVFSENDVMRAQADIKTQLENQGFTVEQVNLIKDSDRHLSGYVKYRKASGIIRPQITKNCTSNMDIDSGKSIWQCK